MGEPMGHKTFYNKREIFPVLSARSVIKKLMIISKFEFLQILERMSLSITKLNSTA